MLFLELKKLQDKGYKTVEELGSRRGWAVACSSIVGISESYFYKIDAYDGTLIMPENSQSIELLFEGLELLGLSSYFVVSMLLLSGFARKLSSLFDIISLRLWRIYNLFYLLYGFVRIIAVYINLYYGVVMAVFGRKLRSQSMDLVINLLFWVKVVFLFI